MGGGGRGVSKNATIMPGFPTEARQRMALNVEQALTYRYSMTINTINLHHISLNQKVVVA